jgi:chemotaxis protein MotB
MPPPGKAVRPIIVIKKTISHGGHHGGAWKVAYADFVTAMMSLFIVLWLLNSTPQIKKAVAGYFNDPRSSGKESGTQSLGQGESVSIDKQNVTKLKDEIQKAILKQADLTKISKQIEITVTSEGLKIELIEDKGGTFFESGSPKLSGSGIALLNLLAAQLKVLPNQLLIEGHTDAQPYSSGTDYTNWELSSDRANSARRILQQQGIGPNQVSQVRGYADQSLHVPGNPLDPSNRRISLIVQWANAALPQVAASPPVAPPPTSPAAVPAPTDVKPSDPKVVSDTPAPTTSTQSAQPTPAMVAKQPAAPQSAWMAHIKGLLPRK